MSKLLNYLRQEGLSTTLKKAWDKSFHRAKSHTIFLRAQSIKANSTCNADIEVLTNENLPEFEKIKFWSFINGSDYIDNPHQSIIMLKKGKEYIGYLAEEHEEKRIIHGLGSLVLKDGEGWLGPVYVKKQWRGQGYNQQMLVEQQRRLQDMNVVSFFTSINSLNSSSLKSFKKAGFGEIGVVNANGEIISDPEGILTKSFHKKDGNMSPI